MTIRQRCRYVILQIENQLPPGFVSNKDYLKATWLYILISMHATFVFNDIVCKLKDNRFTMEYKFFFRLWVLKN